MQSISSVYTIDQRQVVRSRHSRALWRAYYPSLTIGIMLKEIANVRAVIDGINTTVNVCIALPQPFTGKLPTAGCRVAHISYSFTIGVELQ